MAFPEGVAPSFNVSLSFFTAATLRFIESKSSFWLLGPSPEPYNLLSIGSPPNRVLVCSFKPNPVVLLAIANCSFFSGKLPSFFAIKFSTKASAAASVSFMLSPLNFFPPRKAGAIAPSWDDLAERRAWTVSAPSLLPTLLCNASLAVNAVPINALANILAESPDGMVLSPNILINCSEFLTSSSIPKAHKNCAISVFPIASLVPSFDICCVNKNKAKIESNITIICVIKPVSHDLSIPFCSSFG